MLIVPNDSLSEQKTKRITNITIHLIDQATQISMMYDQWINHTQPITLNTFQKETKWMGLTQKTCYTLDALYSK